MNGLDMLNAAPSGGAAGQAVAAKAGDTGSDDSGGDAPRSFNALLATFDEPVAAATQGPVQPTVPAFAPPPSAVLRQALQITAETAAGDASGVAANLASQAADSAPAGKKVAATSATSDDLALTDLVGDSKAPAASSLPDATPSLQIGAPWSAAVSGAAGLVMPTLIGAAVAPAPVSSRQPDAPVRPDQRLAAGGAITDGLSGDVGRLLDAAAGATEAVLSDGAATPHGAGLVLNTNVTVLRTETHLPPVTPTTPLHQVLAAITTDGLGAVAEPAAPGAPDPATALGPERQLVRTLDIRLEPPDLGSVTVKLRLSGEHLTLRISADSAATAQSLEQDRDTLVSMLRGNGYSPEISAVRHEPAAAANILTASGTDSAASSQSGAHQAGSQGSGDGGARSQSGQPGSQQQSQPGYAGFEPTDGHDADVQDTAARSGLYL
jgi:chemotaxis protein MotD